MAQDDDRTLTDPAAQRQPPPPAFKPGAMVGGRYEVVQMLGAGGMGQVYEAVDTALDGRVALKTLRPQVARRQEFVERFRREIYTARKVTHYNVCRIFDLGFDGEQPFLTMELVRGETLRDRVQREGRLGVDQALPLLRGMAAALDAAHAAKVVHRDFKSSNVMLEPSGRVVVTDFGLALPLDDEKWQQFDLTHSGLLIGSAPYMAPEQVEGGPVDERTDVYALGVVMFEALTGTLPWTGDTPIAIATRRLHEDPPSPRSRVPDLDARWERVILRCLQRDPAQRFASAGEVVRALTGEEQPVRARRRWPLAVAVACLLAGAAGLTLRRHAHAPSVRPSVMVLSLHNRGQAHDDDWIGVALAQLVSTEMEAGEKALIVPGETVARLQQSMALDGDGPLAKKPLADLRAGSNARFVIAGSFVTAGPSVRADFLLQDAETGETSARISESGERGQLFELVTRAGARLRQALGVGPAANVSVSLPHDPNAARLYAEGLDLAHRFEPQAARARFEQAIAAEPDFPLSHSALAQVLFDVQEEKLAAAEAARALDLARDLPRRERLWIEGLRAGAQSNWNEAIRVYGAIFTFFPDDLDAGLALAAAQDSAERSQDSLATLDLLRKLPPPAGDDGRIDYSEADSAMSLYDYKRALAAAQRAVDKARTHGHRKLLADALRVQARALMGDEKTAESRAAADAARAISHALGDRGGEGRCLVLAAIAYNSKGAFDKAEAAAREALTILEPLGAKRDIAWAWNNLAGSLFYRGEFEQARPAFERAAAIDHEAGALGDEAAAVANIGAVLLRQGRLGEAQAQMERALALRHELKQTAAEALTAVTLAQILRVQGKLAVARKRAEEGVALARSAGGKMELRTGLGTLCMVAQEQADFAAAHRALDEAKKLTEEMKDANSITYTWEAEVALALEERQLDVVIAAARPLIEYLVKQGDHDNELTARINLAEALAGKGRLAEAHQEIDRATKLGAASEQEELKIDLALASARVALASGNAAEAQRLLVPGIEIARKMGNDQSALELRLELAHARRSASAVRSLEREAKQRGFERVARIARRYER